MLDFKPTEDIISMSEFRTTLADCVARTAETHRPIILTQNGRATSVFLSAADWEKICQKMYDAEIYEDILVSEGESKRGEVYTHDEVKRMMAKHIKKYKPRTNTDKPRLRSAVFENPLPARTLVSAVRERPWLNTPLTHTDKPR